jgi:glutathione S-transferase
MKYYFNPQSRAATTSWMLAELDVPCEAIHVDLGAGENATPEYRAINPMQKVPALVDGDVVVTESAAICAYLADKFADKGLAPAITSKDRGRYYRYLFFPGTTLEPLLTAELLGFEVANPASVGWGDIERGLMAVESMTPEVDWILGRQFTAADVVFGGTLDFALNLDWMKVSPRVRAYVERLRERPAYRTSHGMT